MPIELIAIDLDGTLLNDHKEVTPKVKETLSRAKAQGIKVVICTGRPLIGALEYLSILGLEEEGDYCITYNGALVQSSHDGKAIVHHTLNFEDFLAIEKLSREVGVHCHTIDMNAVYTANKDIGRYTVRECYLTGMPLQYCAVEDMDQNMEIGKMMMIDEPDILDAGIAQLPASFFEKYTVLKSEPFYLEILNKGASKGNAVAGLAEYLKIPRENVMAIGDNENDLDMIEYAGMGVAMDNAVPKVKAVADYITKSNTEDGVAYVVEKYALN